MGDKRKLKVHSKVFVRSFSGATVQHMDNYVKPFIPAQPNHFVFHVTTNDCNFNAPQIEFARKSVDKAGVLKSEKCDDAISEIILRTDKLDLNKKENEFKAHVKEMSKESNNFF